MQTMDILSINSRIPISKEEMTKVENINKEPIPKTAMKEPMK
jgi:hypothetical protein